MAKWAETFSYSADEKEKIFGSLPSLTNETPIKPNNDWNTYLNILKRQTRYNLHARLMADYTKVQRTPRGLRIQKAPTLFSNNEEFKIKWMSILNRCSFDLMTLITEFAIKETERLDKEAVGITEELHKQFDLETFESKFKQLQVELKNYSDNIKIEKLRKFERDRRDYESDHVFPWMQKSMNTSIQPRSTTEFSSSSAESSEQSDSQEQIPHRQIRQPRQLRQYDLRPHTIDYSKQQGFPKRRNQQRRL